MSSKSLGLVCQQGERDQSRSTAVQTEAALEVQGLLELRSKAIEGFHNGSVSLADYHHDLDALTVELDRRLSPDCE